jgi:hypothetical protein
MTTNVIAATNHHSSASSLPCKPPCGNPASRASFRDVVQVQPQEHTQGITIFKTTPLRRKETWINTVIRPCIARSRHSPEDLTRVEEVGEIHDYLPRRKATSTDAALSGFRHRPPRTAYDGQVNQDGQLAQLSRSLILCK